MHVMSKALVAYYSWTGHTRQIAEAIATQLGADVEPIREVHNRAGWLAYFRSAWEALHKTPAAISDIEKDPAAYDLVVLGTPVWAGHVSSPMRAYVAKQRTAFKRIAVFCTEGSASGARALAEMADLAGKDPIATLIVTERDISSGDFRQKVAAFANALG